MDPFISYLRDEILPNDRDQARSLHLRATRYFFRDNTLYKCGISTPILRCLLEEKSKQVLNKCFTSCPRLPPKELTFVISPWPFTKGCIDLISPLPKFKEFCDNFGILKTFSTLAHPQSNGQVEMVNKMIKQTLKKKISKLKGGWVDELPLVLWLYRTSF
ncbi:hypothetical protein UlMin_012321 [Ulmus minor]